MNIFYISSIGKIMNKQKTLYSSMAVVTLGLFCINSQVVQADKLPKNQVTNSSLTKKVVNPKYNSTLASAKPNNDAVSADYLSNKSNSEINNSAIKSEWNNLEVSYNNHVLTIHSGTVTNPKRIAGNIKSVDTSDITKIKLDGKLTINGSALELFSELNNLVSIENLNQLDTTNVTDMSYMFAGCLKLQNINVARFNTTNVTTMRAMFATCDNLTNLDLSNFDSSKAVDMSYMFASSRQLANITFSNKFNTSIVTNMSNMFYDCQSLDGLDLANFKTTRVANMQAMFAYCSKLTNLNLSSFDTSRVYNMQKMFTGDKNLKILDISKFTISNGVNTGDMLSDLASLNTLKLGSNTVIKNTGLNTPVTWSYNGEKFSSAELIEQYDGSKPGTYTAVSTTNPGPKPVDPTPVMPNPKPMPTLVKPNLSSSSVTVHYQDENGNEIAPNKIITGYIGDGYVTPAITAAGYLLKIRPNNAVGFFTKNPQDVVYVYTKASEDEINQADTPANTTPTDKNRQNYTPESNLNPEVTDDNSSAKITPSLKSTNLPNNENGVKTVAATDKQNIKTLPQTGFDEKSRLVALFFGSLAIFISSIGTWFNHKKD